MEDKIIEESNKFIEQLTEQGIDQGNNLDNLNKLVEIKKDALKIKCMEEGKQMYGNYGNNYGRRYDAYGRENYGNNYGDNYGRRGYDMKYRGHDYLDRMYENYGRYEDGRQRYGHNEDTKKSLKYMLESMEDFAHMLKEDAQSQEEVQMIRETAQRIANM